jgi:hypothetical protein
MPIRCNGSRLKTVGRCSFELKIIANEITVGLKLSANELAFIDSDLHSIGLSSNYLQMKIVQIIDRKMCIFLVYSYGTPSSRQLSCINRVNFGF